MQAWIFTSEHCVSPARPAMRNPSVSHMTMSSGSMIASASNSYSRPLTKKWLGSEGTRMLACPRAAVSPFARPRFASTRFAVATSRFTSSRSVVILTCSFYLVFLVTNACNALSFLLLGSHLPLRLTENREVGDFVEGNFTVHFQGCFSFFNHDAQSLFAETWILVVDLDHAFVGSRRDFSIDL